MRNLIRDGSLGPIHSARREIVRRIFVTVRDRNWQEIPPATFSYVVDKRRVELSARHSSELVDFEWRGTLKVGDDARTMRFAFEGKALRPGHVPPRFSRSASS